LPMSEENRASPGWKHGGFPSADREIVHRLARLEVIKRRYLLGRGLCGFLSTTAVAFTLLLLGDWVFHFPALLRAVLLGAGVALLTRQAWMLGRRYLRAQPVASMAMLLEEKFATFDGALLTAAELADTARRQGVDLSEEMYGVTAERAHQAMRGVDLTPLLHRRALAKAVVLVLACLSVVLAPLAFAPQWWTTGTVRLLAPFGSASWPKRNEIHLDPNLQSRIRRGGALHIRGFVSGPIPSRGILLVRPEAAGDRWREISFPIENDGRFHIRFQPVTTSMAARVTAGDAVSAPIEVEMVPPPEIVSLRVHCEYPEYTRLPATESAAGDVEAPYQTGVRLAVATSKPVERASLVWLSGRDSAMDIDAATGAVIRFQVENDDRYSIALEDSFGFTNENPPVYRVRVIGNKLPQIRIRKPGKNKVLTPDARLQLIIEGNDDYGIEAAALVCRVNGEERPGIPLALDALSPQVTIRFEWDLASLKTAAGDHITYWVTMRDQGGHRQEQPQSESDRYSIAIVEPELFVEQIVERMDRALDQLGDVERTQSESASAVREAHLELGESGKVGSVRENVRNERWRQDYVRRQTVQVAAALGEIADDMESCGAGGETQVERLRGATSVLQYTARENMEMIVQNLTEALNVLRESVEGG
jgi:hypothetical protein